MVYITFKIALSTAVVALLALTHVQAAPTKDGVLTLEEIGKVGDRFISEMFKPEKTMMECKAQCYTEALRAKVGGIGWSKQVDTLDRCVKRLLGDMHGPEDIVAYNDKKLIFHWNMAQYCADVVEATGQISIFKIPAVQGYAMKCSRENCDGPYDAAASAAFQKAGVRLEEAMED
ncbi:hypothetical protein BGZ72_008115 [Mortierella alpina]|nr:hypothetical protein BGZ72_008115 [Mortierella alpina]